MPARETGLKVLSAIGLMLGIWIAIDWGLSPRLPQGSGRDLQLFPLLAIQINAILRGALPLSLGLGMYALVAISVLLAPLLAVRLAFAAVASPAARRLALALSLATLSAAWFWFFRDMAPWIESVRPWRVVLDPAGMLAGVYALVALVGCFRIYPEPLTQEFSERGFSASLEWQRRHAQNKRAGTGIWRLWAWLPREHYGAYGRTQSPGLSGWRRWLRSREFIWLLAIVAITVGGPWVTGWWAAEPPWWRIPLWLMLAGIVVMTLDPVAQARIDDDTVLRRISRRNQSAVSRGELAIHRFFGSPPGLLLLGGFALGVYGLWQTQASAFAPLLAFLLILSFTLLTFGHAVGLLFLNWRHGTAESRRAIGWIFLGTGGTALAWFVLVNVVGLLGLGRWAAAAQDVAVDRRMLAGTALVGPSLIALAHVFSLWLSVLSRGSFDAKLALRRGTGIAAMGVLLTALFVALEGAVSSQVVVRLGMPSEAGSLVAGTLVALAFVPIRNQVDRRVNHVVQRLLPAEALVAGERRELAIVFADLSGYTRLSETDEAEAMTLAAVLHQSARAVAARHGGRLVKTIGDAVLLVFDSAEHALRAVIELHARYDQEAQQRELEHLPVHSGMHMGDVVVAAQGDVFGAHVNLAARLQALAGPGEVVTSTRFAAAFRELGIDAEAMPARRFKNIAEPVDCFRWRVAV